MSLNLQQSIKLITSCAPNIDSFGTGFVIYQDKQSSYLLTCAHVVRDVGGPELVRAGNTQATVIASGLLDGVDLAVLRVEELLDGSPLHLQTFGQKGRAFITAGFQLYGKQFLVRPLRGVLGEEVGIEMKGQSNRIKAWDLSITDEYQLQPGYSGSPLVDEARGLVIGVVSNRQGDGKKGLAISIEALKNIWQERSFLVFDAKASEEAPSQVKVRTLSTQERHKLVDLLFACETIHRKESRDEAVRELRGEITASLLRDNQNTKLDIRLIVNTCLNYSGGLHELTKIVQTYEGNSLPMQRLCTFMDEVPPEL